MHRILSLPATSEKKRMAVLSHELASGGAEVRAPLDDYMLLSRDARTRVDTVLAPAWSRASLPGTTRWPRPSASSCTAST